MSKIIGKKRIVWLALLTMIVSLFAGVSGSVYAGDTTPTVDVMFLHDTHSHLKEFATVEEGVSRVMGGFARLKTLIQEQKEINPDTLLLDAGDFSMGTLIQVVYESEASEIRMLGELGMDVVTLGNHEFDYGVGGLAHMITNAVDSGDRLPELVLCNIDWETMLASPELMSEEVQGLATAMDYLQVKDYAVLNKNGVDIAVIGVFGIDALACVPNCPIVFSDPIEAVKETVAEIKANENVDMIVCVSHGGTTSNPDKSEDELLAQAVPELDLIISGHSHTMLKEPIQYGRTYIVSVGEYGKYLGSLQMMMTADGRWQMTEYKPIPVTEDIPADADTQDRVAAFEDMVDVVYLDQFGYTKDQVLCTNDIPFSDGNQIYFEHTEHNLGSIMADAYTYAVEKYDVTDTHPVDVTVVPSGVIRDTYALGDITVEKVFNSFSLGIGQDGIPGYPLISVYLTGEELKLAAEIDASVSDLMTSARLYTDGLYWNFNPNRMILNKVTDVYLVDGSETRVELEDDKLYRVVTDFYSSQMLGGVTDMSFGLLSLVPKFADGTPIENYEDAVIMIPAEGVGETKELKAWAAIADYMDSFADADGDGVGEVPVKYAAWEGRKVVEDTRNIFALLKNPNRFHFLILAIVLVVIALIVLIVVLMVKLVKTVIRRVRRHRAANK